MTDAIPNGTQWRHQRRGNGDTGDHVSAVLLGETNHPGKATKKGDQNVPQVGSVRASNWSVAAFNGEMKK